MAAIRFASLLNSGVRLTVVVSPKAKTSKFRGVYGDAIKVSVAAPPEDGRANEELIDLISLTLDIPKRAIQIISGLTSKRKIIEIVTEKPELLLKKLDVISKTPTDR
jgi:uncharacterized protein (TIGR00251 family)